MAAPLICWPQPDNWPPTEKERQRTAKLCAFIEKCHREGIISQEQRDSLEGVSQKTSAERVLCLLLGEQVD